MTCPLVQLQNLRRPRLLVRAARAGLPDYQRGPHLAEALGSECSDAGQPALTTIARLLGLEADLNAQRKRAARGYCYARHVSVLIALMSEAEGYKAAPHAQPPIAAE